jgi:TnpA family transposase
LASLAKKQTSQSTIIRKLSSYSKKNNILKALIEFDRIVMSTYMLEYINDIEMRRRVHRALNRGEAFHQLRSAILQISGKKILGKTDKAYEVSNQCNKILCCCMIYYNTSLLSSLLEKAEADEDTEMVKFIKRLSPVAWQHINLIGNFTFRYDENIIDIQQVIGNMLEKKSNLNIDKNIVS